MIDDLRELYQEVILDHGKNPRNFRRPEDANREARGDNPLCGDRMTIYLTIDGDEVIQDAAFEGRGCAISTASASMMTDMVRGKTVAAAKALFQTFHTMCTEEAAVAVEDRFADDMAKLQVLSGGQRREQAARDPGDRGEREREHEHASIDNGDVRDRKRIRRER